MSSFAPPHLGGLETCAAALFLQARRSRLDMRWLFSNVPDLPAAPHTVRVSVWNGVESRYGIPIPVPTLRAAKRLFSEVKRADLVHLHDTMYLHCGLAALFARLLRRPILVTLHIWTVPYRGLIPRLLQRVAVNTLGRFVLSAAGTIICYNRKIFTKITDRYPDKTVFIPNGISETFAQRWEHVGAASRAAARLSLDLPRDSTIAVFAGRFVEKKGLLTVRDLAVRHPTVEFLLCGSGPLDPASWELPNVTTLGQLAPEDLARVFTASDILLLPSVGEGFPLVIQEAMASGLPCCILHETWEAWGRDPERFVLAADVNDLCHRFSQYVERPFPLEERQSLARYAADSWDWLRSGAHYRDAYARLLHSSADPLLAS